MKRLPPPFFVVFLFLLFGGFVKGEALSPSADTESQQANDVYYFLIDVSPSMQHVFNDMGYNNRGGRFFKAENQSTRLNEVKAQVIDYLQAISSKYRHVRVRIYLFCENTSKLCSVTLGDDPKDYVDLLRNVRNIRAIDRSAGTYVFSSLKTVYEIAESEVESDPTIRTARIVCLSDGEDSDPNPPISFFREKVGERSSANWSKLDPVFVSIRQRDEPVRQIEKILSDVHIPVHIGDKATNLIPPHPVLRIHPSEYKTDDGGTYVVGEGQPILFVSVSDGKIAKTTINIDGQVSESREIEKVFDRPGEHLATITVYGEGEGIGQSRIYRVVATEKVPLNASFTVSSAKIDVGRPTTFINSSQGAYDRAEWHVEDAVYHDLHFAQHAFKSPGTYNVTLKIADSDGRSSECKEIIHVEAPKPPTARILAFPETPLVGEDVIIRDITSEGVVAKREWRVDGASLGSDEAIKAVFNQIGERVIELVVTDAFGNESVARQTVDVKPIPAPRADFGVSDARPQARRAFTVFARNKGGAQIVDYHWSIDDHEILGTEDRPDEAQICINDAGVHEIKLTVVGPGGEDSIVQRVNVAPIDAPKSKFLSPDAVQVDVETKILDASKEADEIVYEIDGLSLNEYPHVSDEKDDENGDSESSSSSVLVVDDSVNPVLIFTEARSYKISQITRNDGGQDVFDREINVAPHAPPTVRLVPPSSIVAGDLVQIGVVTTGDVQTCSVVIGEKIIPLDMSSKSDDGFLTFEHVFNAGRYEVVCEAIGRGGSVRTEPTILDIKEKILAPVANFAIDYPKTYGVVPVRFANKSIGTGPFNVSILKNGAIFKEIHDVDGSALDEWSLAPGVYRVSLTAKSGDYAVDTKEAVFRIRAHSSYFWPTIAGISFVVLGLLTAFVWLLLILRGDALKGVIVEYRSDENMPWQSKAINNFFSKAASIVVDETIGKIRIEKRLTPTDVRYKISLRTGESATFSKYKPPTKNRPVAVGRLLIAVHDLS